MLRILQSQSILEEEGEQSGKESGLDSDIEIVFQSSKKVGLHFKIAKLCRLIGSASFDGSHMKA